MGSRKKPRNLMEAVLKAKPGPPVEHYKVWVGIDPTEGVPLTWSAAYSKADCRSYLEYDNWPNAPIKRATLSVVLTPPPKPKKEGT